MDLADESLNAHDTLEKQTKLYRDLLADQETKSDLIESLVDTLSYDIEPDHF